MQTNRVDRRSFLKLAAGAAVGAGMPGWAWGAAAAEKGRRPNIIVILADDMGFSDIGCYGGEIATPNLDALAKNGMRFTQFYNTARCCPTRACLLTGLYPHQAGVGHMVENKGHPSYQGYLNDSCVTIAEAIRPAGYHAVMAGKWHVGEKRPHWPVDRGFEHAYGLVSGGSNYFKLDKGRIFGEDDKSIDPTSAPGFYMTNAFTDAGVRYVEEYGKKNEPFFMYMAYTSPHWPLHALPEDIAKYKGKYMKGWDALREERRERMIKLGIIDKNTPLTPRDSRAKAWDQLSTEEKEERDLRMAVYAAQIDRMDQNIGRLIAKLKETGQFDNTVILFMADNGGCAEIISRSEDPKAPIGSKGSFLSYGIPWANASNTPFRMYKHWVHEGGISSPLIAHWPGHIKPNSFHRQPAHLIDIMPTCLELAGGEHPTTYKGKRVKPLEGNSLVPVLEGWGATPGRAIYWEHEGNRAVRQGKYKLVAQEGKAWELYDISADRAELKNLAEKEPEKVKGLAAMYEAWAKRCEVVEWKELNKKSG